LTTNFSVSNVAGIALPPPIATPLLAAPLTTPPVLVTPPVFAGTEVADVKCVPHHFTNPGNEVTVAIDTH
jgi:hypothetical protein